MADDNKKSMDVATAGNQTPSSSSKPIIVTNHPSVADSIIKNDDPQPDVPKPAVSRTSNVVKPPEGSEERIAAEQNDGDGSTTQNPTDNAISDSSNVVDAVVEGAVTKKEKDQKDTEQNIEYQKVIESKKYHVKISDGGSSSSIGRAFVILVLVLGISAIIFNLLLDAEILDIGIKPFTNFL